jgi:hypothetical protein
MRQLRRDCGHWRRFAASRRAGQKRKAAPVEAVKAYGLREQLARDANLTQIQAVECDCARDRQTDKREIRRWVRHLDPIVRVNQRSNINLLRSA